VIGTLNDNNWQRPKREDKKFSQKYFEDKNSAHLNLIFKTVVTKQTISSFNN